VYWQFAEAVRGIGDMCRVLNTPVTGGNVSFHNESQQHAIFPTPTIGMLGLIDNIDRTVGNSFTSEGEVVVLIGWQRENLGGSEYLKIVKGRITGEAPYIDSDEEARLQRSVLRLIRDGVVSCAHDCAEGGLLVALAEMTFLHGIGITAAIPFAHNAANLFGEAQSRVLVSLPESALTELKSVCDEEMVPMIELGRTGGKVFAIKELVETPISDLKDVYESVIPSIMSMNFV
jgi:phosphoribosylformylglycinamidine synthase